MKRKGKGGPSGTVKTPIVGAVERDGNIVAQVADDLSGKGLLNFIQSVTGPKAQILVTDEFKS